MKQQAAKYTERVLCDSVFGYLGVTSVDGTKQRTSQWLARKFHGVFGQKAEVSFFRLLFYAPS